MKLFDMHVHTRGVSKCSRLSPEELCEAIKTEGSDGFILTNHYSAYMVDRDFIDWLHKYEDEYYHVKDVAASYGLRTLFGMEVTIDRRDYLLYGVKPSCLYESKGPLYMYTLSELRDFAHERGALLIHAHPWRFDGQPSDPSLLDGVEINCHPLYMDNCKRAAWDFAEKHHLLLTCGSDYHGDVYKAHCGMYLPDDLVDEEELARYMKNIQPLLLIHDIDERRSIESNIHRKKENKT